jgi:4-hydroxy-3-methylbut-2-enyl diphosphate reductase
MAIKALSAMVRLFDPPVYCYHEIVHNEQVVARFEALGVVFVDDIADVPEGAPLMLSAHGSAPEVVEAAKARAGTVVNAVCPLVTKVHHELKVRVQRGYDVIYVGHAGHEEAEGTLAVAPEHTRLVERPEDLEHLDGLGDKVALLAQTTLSTDEWSAIADRAGELHPDLWMPSRSDLCFATTNRQQALRAVASGADAVVVVGSANSSNTNALVKVAATLAPRVVRVSSAEDLPDDLSGVVAVTAGASAPEDVVCAVIDRLDPAEGIEERSVLDEDEYFPPPRELRDLLRRRALDEDDALAAQLLSELAADRSAPAASVLDALRG